MDLRQYPIRTILPGEAGQCSPDDDRSFMRSSQPSVSTRLPLEPLSSLTREPLSPPRRNRKEIDLRRSSCLGESRLQSGQVVRLARSARGHHIIQFLQKPHTGRGIMRVERMVVASLLAAGLVVLPACTGENRATPESGSQGAIVKGGDDRAGEYEGVEDWWQQAPDHEGPWTWGQVSGVAVDNPNRIVVAIWGDRDREGREREGGSNYLVVVGRDGNILENWSQWDSIFNKPHQVYISPYDPERHVWVVERGGGRDVNMQILKFTNDGSELVMRLVDPRPSHEPGGGARRPEPRPLHLR